MRRGRHLDGYVDRYRSGSGSDYDDRADDDHEYDSDDHDLYDVYIDHLDDAQELKRFQELDR